MSVWDCERPGPPPCHRCGQEQFEHDFLEVETCAAYVLPGSLAAEWMDFSRAIGLFFRSLLPGWLR